MRYMISNVAINAKSRLKKLSNNFVVDNKYSARPLNRIPNGERSKVNTHSNVHEISSPIIFWSYVSSFKQVPLVSIVTVQSTLLISEYFSKSLWFGYIAVKYM